MGRQIRPVAFVSLTIDHRTLDGVRTNAWLSRFVEVLEGWARETNRELETGSQMKYGQPLAVMRHVAALTR